VLILDADAAGGASVLSCYHFGQRLNDPVIDAAGSPPGNGGPEVLPAALRFGFRGGDDPADPDWLGDL